MVDAAEASLRLLAADPDAERRRVVVAADVPDRDVQRRRDVPLLGARCGSRCRWTGWPASTSTGRRRGRSSEAAIDALAAADAGDDDARFLLDEAEACDLLWYDVSELDRLP